MDLGELDHNEEYTGESSMDRLHLTDLPNTDNIYEEPSIPPRIGEQYQVEIPSLITESERVQLRQCPLSTVNVPGIDYPTGIGLVIPIMWVHHVGYPIKHEVKESPNTMTSAAGHGSMDSGNNEERPTGLKCCGLSGYPLENSDHHGMHPQGSACKIEFLDDQLNCGEVFTESTTEKCTLLGDHKANVYIPLPGSSVVSWSDAEKESFLLGLYIFGKNLVQVRKFMESKQMGDILSYYYGEFYRSDAYRRWSVCRKIRSRKCIYGQRIFTGWRQQELLSRLLPSIPKEVQDTLLEVTRTFNEGRVSLEEYVSTLKAVVGMQGLVEAIGISKEKCDLTGFILDPGRSNQSISIRPEIPIGKACSSLTSGDIIKFLTGDFRISKARSNDLFWEAVWPRLLARGWHSEQPKDRSFLGPKHGLVFLAPGIKKFSRRKLVKGTHYFDSVSDVLSKVASDPRLLDLEAEGSKGNSSLDKDCSSELYTKVDRNGLPDHQRHCYLRPRLPTCNSQLMKFTVVDTSLIQGDAPFKVRELRSLPVDAPSCDNPSIQSGETESDSSEEQSESTNVSLNNQGESDNTLDDNKSKTRFQSDGSDHLFPGSKRGMSVNGKNSNDKSFDLSKQKQPVKDIKYQFSRRPKSSQPNSLSTVSKRQRLTACKHADKECHSDSYSRGHQLKKGQTCFEFESHEVSDIMGLEVGQSRGTIPNNSLGKGSPDGRSDYNLCENVAIGVESDTRSLHEKPQPQTWFDLNFLPDSDAAEHVCNEVIDSHDALIPKAPSPPLESHEQLDVSQASGTSNVDLCNQQLTMNSRRQSTRNRPLTTKALEALACGFLTTKRKWRGNTPSSDGLTSRPSRRARKSVEAPMPFVDSNLCS